MSNLIKFIPKHCKWFLNVPYTDAFGKTRMSNSLTETIYTDLTKEQVCQIRGITLKESLTIIEGKTYQINDCSVSKIDGKEIWRVRYLLGQILEEDPIFANAKNMGFATPAVVPTVAPVTPF